MTSFQRNHLFHKYDLGATIRAQSEGIEGRVDSLPKDQFITSSDQELFDHFMSAMEIQPLQLHEDSSEMDQEELQIDVSRNRRRNPFPERESIMIPGVRVTISVPWTGEPQLWDMKPSQHYLNFPYGEIREPNSEGIGYLNIVIEQPHDQEHEKIKEELDRNLDLIKDFIGFQKNEITQQNERLPKKIEVAIQNRRDRLNKQEGISGTLKIPLKRKEGAPNIENIPLKRKLVRPLPSPSKPNTKQEWGILDKDYEHILGVIRHEGRTFETTPNTYSVHDEEELRDIVLAHLNGHYQGEASAEAFRKKGKTDIRIEFQDRAAFVAECKIWRGQEDLFKAVNQLLGYLTWRDCKTALIIFNKHNAKFKEILKKIPDALSDHPKIIKFLGGVSPGEWKYIFASEEDDSHEVLIHVFIFNLFIK